MFNVQIHVRLRPSILDPQGKAVLQAIQSSGEEMVQEVRMGKLIELQMKGSSVQEVEEKAKQLADQLLANPVMEDYEIIVKEMAL